MAPEGRAYRTVHGIRVGMVAAGVDTEAAREPRCRWPLSARRHAVANAALREALAREAAEAEAEAEVAVAVAVAVAQAPGSHASQSQANKNKEIEEHNK
mgnify:FL=1